MTYFLIDYCMDFSLIMFICTRPTVDSLYEYQTWIFLGRLRDVRPHFSFPDSNSKTVCPIEFKLDRDIDQHHS